MDLGLDEWHREEFVGAVEAKDGAAVRALLEAHAPLRDQIDAPWLSFDAPAIVHSVPDREMVDLLLEFGADVNAKSSWWAGGFTALHHATGRMLGFDAEQAAYLIHRGAEVDAWAAAGLEMMDRLAEIVEARPGVLNQPGPDGMRPLHFAATPAVADYLLDRGADIDARCIDHHGSALQWSLGNNNPELARHLLSRGADADIFACAAIGDVARVAAALDGDPKLVNARMDQEAPGGYVYLYTSIGRECTPLHAAASHDQADVLQLLLDRGADPDARDANHNGTPLGWAAHFNASRAEAILRPVTPQT